jgi:uncharacterized protein (DUF3820 family)
MFGTCIKPVLYLWNNKTNVMQNFTLKFGKYKGTQFLSTPASYQNWLVSQDWFKMPVVMTEMQQAQKMVSQCANKLKGWNGYSKAGSVAYDNMFEAEKAMDAAYYNDSDPSSPRWNGEYNFL